MFQHRFSCSISSVDDGDGWLTDACRWPCERRWMSNIKKEKLAIWAGACRKDLRRCRYHRRPQGMFYKFCSETCRQDTHSQYTSVQHSLFTSAERTPRAWLKSSRIAFYLCAPEKNLSSGVAHVSPFFVLSPAVHHEHIIFLSHSSFYHYTKNMQHNRFNMINSKNTQYIMHISKLFQSTSSATNNHSGVKTCRVAETRARQLPQVVSPKSLRLSRGSKIVLEIHSNYMMHRKDLEKKITELRSPKK